MGWITSPKLPASGIAGAMKVIIIVALLIANLRSQAHKLPDVDAKQLDDFIDAAAQEETKKVPAALLTSLAWAESRFKPDATPACGVMQVYPHDIDRPQSDCDVWRKDVRAGVHAGVVEIEMLLADRRVNGDMFRALMYRACGNVFFDGTCDVKKERWVNAAIARWRWLEAAGIGS